jgi:inhibitor of KinA sporulation pathway (predicted exonuclease)
MQLPNQYVIFDTEYTAWEGSQARNWSAPGEYREIVQLGAIKVDKGHETDYFLMYAKPTKNPKLSAYIIDLTQVTQADIDTKGVPFATLINQFAEWTESLPLYCCGHDGTVLTENCDLVGVSDPIADARYHDIRPYFAAYGVDPAQYMSSSIPRAFGVTPPPAAHDALNDARSILCAINASR